MRKPCVSLPALFLICFFYLRPGVCQSQYLRSNWLFTFLQNNFDTTIIFCPFSNWSAFPNYYIISKKNKQIFLFTYCSPYEQIGKYPDSLRGKLLLMQSEFQLTEPDINEYFLTKKSKDSVTENFWSEIFQNGIWGLTNAVDNMFCTGKDSTQYSINDAGEEYFFLITKHGNKPVYFYAPEFFEEHCPGNINRIRAIKIIRLFYTLYTKDL